MVESKVHGLRVMPQEHRALRPSNRSVRACRSHMNKLLSSTFSSPEYIPGTHKAVLYLSIHNMNIIAYLMLMPYCCHRRAKSCLSHLWSSSGLSTDLLLHDVKYGIQNSAVINQIRAARAEKLANSLKPPGKCLLFGLSLTLCLYAMVNP